LIFKSRGFEFTERRKIEKRGGCKNGKKKELFFVFRFFWKWGVVIQKKRKKSTFLKQFLFFFFCSLSRDGKVFFAPELRGENVFSFVILV